LRGVDKMLVLREGVLERFGSRAEVMERVTARAAAAA
jgi:ABC-type protease/lipase transport system fused ATPase/permease subunit